MQGRRFISLLLAVVVEQAVAQVPLAFCNNPDYNWSQNSLNQTACQIAEALGGACTDDFVIHALPLGMHYAGLSGDSATDCICNYVYWSLLNVCAACQGGYVSDWSSWSKNCSSASFNRFTESIPGGVAIPHYAFLNPLTNGSFDFATARNDTGPDVFGPPRHNPTAGPHATSTASHSLGTSHAGAIAGGVIGGLALLGLIAVLLLHFCVLIPRAGRAKNGVVNKPFTLTDSESSREKASSTPKKKSVVIDITRQEEVPPPYEKSPTSQLRSRQS